MCEHNAIVWSRSRATVLHKGEKMVRVFKRGGGGGGECVHTQILFFLVGLVG